MHILSAISKQSAGITHYITGDHKYAAPYYACSLQKDTSGER